MAIRLMLAFTSFFIFLFLSLKIKISIIKIVKKKKKGNVVIEKIRQKNESYPPNHRYTTWKYLLSSEVQHPCLGKSSLFKAQSLKRVYSSREGEL